MRRRKVWYLYRFWDRHGNLLYIGQSSNPRLRRDRHADKFWWPRYLDGGTWQVDPQPYPTLVRVLDAEKRAIWAEKPLCNVEHNQHNPDRILPPPGWRSPANVRPRSGRPVNRRRWTRRRIRRAVLASAWLLLAVGLLATMANPTGGGGGVAALGVIVLFGAHKPRRRRR